MRVYFGPARHFRQVFVQALLMQKERFNISREPIFDQVLRNMVLGQALQLKKK